MGYKRKQVGDTIECSKCGVNFEKYQKHGRRCRQCINAYNRMKRRRTRNAATKKYEKTKKGFLMRAYRNMQSRIQGIQKKSWHLYCGLELLPRDEFYEWSFNNPDFHDLFEEWERLKYEQKFTPSIDRIDPRQGYHILNMQWVTVSENSKRAVAWTYYGKII